MKSTLSVLIIATYIVLSLCIRAGPWHYFHINHRHFCRKLGIFSKMSLDKLIPLKWRLDQRWLDDDYVPAVFPVFMKPEWGQNSVGIERADNEHQFNVIARRVKTGPIRYMVQQAAPEAREFEIFTTFIGESSGQPDYFTVTETVNDRHRYPINGIYNNDCRYVDITKMLTPSELTRISNYVREIGHFGQSRLSVRADSIEQLTNGEFHVIEINLFTPMPIHLLDEKHSVLSKLRQVLSIGWSLARVTRAMNPWPMRGIPWVYTRMCSYGRRQKAAQEAWNEQQSGNAVAATTAKSRNTVNVQHS